MAVDLDGITSEASPGEDEWRRYLAGDRARVRAPAGGYASTTTRSTASPRSIATSAHFRDAANTYLAEFEALLARARQGDGGGLLTSTMLSADTGKIYLAMAYALGRL